MPDIGFIPIAIYSVKLCKNKIGFLMVKYVDMAHPNIGSCFKKIHHIFFKKPIYPYIFSCPISAIGPMMKVELINTYGYMHIFLIHGGFSSNLVPY